MDLLLFMCGVVEFTHYQKQVGVYNHFNTLRVKYDTSMQDVEKCIDKIISVDGDFFERASICSITNRIKTRTDLYDFFSNPGPNLEPPDIAKPGNSELYWSYTPFCVDIFMKQLRLVGEKFMKWNTYTQSTYATNDGYFNVFTYENKDSIGRPLIFFPGLGFGAIPYATVAKAFGRTVHIIEVPNFCYATPNTTTHATGESLSFIVKKCVGDQDHDVIGHSFGGFHATIYLNESHSLRKVKKILICEGFNNPIDVLMNHLIPFVNNSHFGSIPVVRFPFARFNFFIHMIAYNIYIHSFCKRHINIINSTLWREYDGVRIKYIYSENDPLIDSNYIMQRMNPDDYYCIKNGTHGSCFFSNELTNVVKILDEL